MKKLLPLLFACLLAPSIALAQPGGSARLGPDVEQPNLTPDQILKLGIEDLQAFLASDQATDPQALMGMIRARIAPQFDMYTMARWTGGYWFRQMTPEQQQAFTLKLAKSFFSSLADILAGYQGNSPDVRFMPPRFVENNEATVAARVYPRNSYPIDISFAFHNTPNGWRIFDVTTNGISAVNYYRKMFNSKVRQTGSVEVLYK
jgi:phospholipid transport system substrate-binding protein